jgi:hypothetical protein
MDMNEFALEILARNRIAELRAEAERSHQRRAVRPRSRPFRIVLGHALIWMGRRLQGVRGPSLTDRRGSPRRPGTVQSGVTWPRATGPGRRAAS